MTTAPRRTDVTLVVPVYSALDETIACIQSILDSDGGDCPIIINDDGSPVYVGDRLREHFAHAANVDVRTSFRNRGYTANVQFGVEASRTIYVAIINSDTLFPARWLDKLAGTLDANPLLAAVGPLSNAASYQSIPLLKDRRDDFSSNPDFGLTATDRATVNAFLEAFFPGLVEDIPILNGFCTVYRTRAILDAGGFDPVSFPTGYGEENDVCMRLLASGARLGVRLDCFVHHLKSRSFGSDKKKEYSRNGREAIARLYGETFVPAFAEVMERSGVLSGIRFTTQAALGDADQTRLKSGAAERSACAKGTGDAASVITLTGPCNTTIFPDRHLVGPFSASPGHEDNIALTIGSGYLRICLPEGKSIAFTHEAPLQTALGCLAVWSHFSPVVVNQIPVSSREPAISQAMEALAFRYLYLTEDVTPGLARPAFAVA